MLYSQHEGRQAKSDTHRIDCEGARGPVVFQWLPGPKSAGDRLDKKRGAGVSPAPFGDFCAYKSHPGSGAGEAPSKSTRFQESPIKERKEKSAFQRSFSILSTISPMAPSKQWHTTVAPEASTSGTALAGQKARSAASSMGRSFM